MPFNLKCEPMKTISLMVTYTCLLFLCSCATENSIHPILPAESSFIQNDGRENGIFVKLRLESGEELLLLVDTGRPNTILDKSLEPKLGKRLGTSTCLEPLLGGVSRAGVYKAPKLYLGNTQLLTNSRVYTYDWQRLEPGLMGILGMDCLRHYCIQLDFTHNKLRFLDPYQLDDHDLGEGFPLTILFGLVIAHADCFGTGKVYFCPDTGCTDADAMLKPKLFDRALKQQRPVWTNQFAAYSGTSIRGAAFSTGVFGGQTYSNLIFMEWAGTWPDGDLIGLPFLARNLVTFNFPKRMMFLKQEDVGPHYPSSFLELEAGNYLGSLVEKGQLPGWAKSDKGGEGELSQNLNSFTNYPITLTFNIRKSGVPGWVDVTPKVKSLVADGARRISADSDLAGCDPAPYTVKRLQVTFRVNNRQRIAEAMEGKTLTLPAEADVVHARYGDLQGHFENRSQISHDFSVYHYTLVQESKDSPWKLQKAWRTDADGRLIEEYAVP